MKYFVRYREQNILNALSKNKNVLEIGTFDGGSAKNMLLNGAQSVTTIDIYAPEKIQTEGGKKEYTQVYKNNNVTLQTARENLKQFDNCQMFVGDSQKILPTLVENYFDMIFIDGDHSYEGVKADFFECDRLIKDNGVIALHDNESSFPGVQKLVNEIRENKNYKYIGQEQTLVYFQKNNCVNSRAVITYIDEKYEDIFIKDFLFSLRNHAYFFGEVYLVYTGDNQNFIELCQNFYNVTVFHFSEFNKPLYTHRNELLINVLENIENNRLLICDCDIIFQKEIDYLFNKNSCGVVEETGEVVSNFITAAYNRAKDKNKLIKHIPFLSKKTDKIYNSGMISGPKNIILNLLKQIDKIINDSEHSFFGLDQLAFTQVILYQSDTSFNIQKESKLYNYSFASNKENVYIKNNSLFDKDLGLINMFHNTGADRKFIKQPIYNFPITGQEVTVVINTYNRTYTTLPLCLQSIATQTVAPESIIIYDDNEIKINLVDSELFQGTIALLNKRKIRLKIIDGQKKGQVWNHKKSIEDAETQYIWRIDDDCIAEPNALKNLILHIDKNVGAIAPTILNPYNNILKPGKNLNGTIDTSSYQSTCLQWFDLDKTHLYSAQQLHSSFLFNKDIAKNIENYGYDTNLSRIGHTEETIFSHEIYRAGYKLLINPNARIWHYHAQGGIRSFIDKQLWENDKKYFNEKIYTEKWGYKFRKEKYVIVQHGLGDVLAFLPVLEKMLKKYSDHIICIGTHYPQVFEPYRNNPKVEISDVFSIELWVKDIEKYSVYALANQLDTLNKLKNKYEKTDINKKYRLQELYEKIYLEDDL